MSGGTCFSLVNSLIPWSRASALGRFQNWADFIIGSIGYTFTQIKRVFNHVLKSGLDRVARLVNLGPDFYPDLSSSLRLRG